MVQADDWPKWLGPDQDAVWKETGVVTEFPESGPTIAWRAPLGHGYSSPAVEGGKVYVTDYEITSGEIENNPGGKSKLEGKERIHCFNAESGEPVWSREWDRPYFLSYAGGPRAMPTIADGKVYFLGAEGDLRCLDAATGETVWEKNFLEEYGAETPMWGHSAHPLVKGDTLYCVVGGEGSVAVAFDKDTGEEKWKALSAVEPGYCPPTMIEHAGVEQLLIWHSQDFVSLNPEDGSIYWSVPLKPQYAMAIMSPRKVGNLLFASSIGRVAALVKLDDEKPAAEIIWKATPKESVFCANSSPFIHDGIVYGSDVDTSSLIAARLSDGERLWTTTVPTLGEENPERGGRHGTAFITRHEESGMYFLFSETGDLIVADLSESGYSEKSRAHILEPTNEAFGRPVVWAAPAYAMKSAFVRNDKEIVRVDLSN